MVAIIFVLKCSEYSYHVTQKRAVNKMFFVNKMTQILLVTIRGVHFHKAVHYNFIWHCFGDWFSVAVNIPVLSAL